MLDAMVEKNDPSGMVVYPKLPIPKPRQSEPKVKGFKDPSSGGGGFSLTKLLVGLVLAAAIGVGVGWFLGPKGTVAKVKKELAAAQTATKVEKDRADGAEQRAAVLEKDKADLEQKLSEASAKAGELGKQVADANAAAEKKLSAAIDKSQGSVSTEGDEIHLKLVDKVLFAVGDDQLTDKGKAALDKVAKALAELPDKQIWVQGHTDDTPILIPPAPKPDPKDAKKKKGAKPEPPPAPMVRFASNWELSAARALQVVHYLQDHGKIEPTRLAALAFSEYRPVSRTNRALNRRIEIVLYPQHAVVEKTSVKAIEKEAPPTPAPAAGSAAQGSGAGSAAPKTTPKTTPKKK
jgi:chemotaxis protein MotB